jgi:hypothetical protein
MPYALYNFLHISAVLLLVGFTFYAFAGPNASTRKWVLSIGGIASLIVLATGFIMVMKMQAFPGWIWLKLFAWLGVSALAGIAYRRRGLVNILMLVAVLLAVMAAWAVTYKPF